MKMKAHDAQHNHPVAPVVEKELGESIEVSVSECVVANGAGLDHHDHHSEAQDIVYSFKTKSLMMAYLMEMGIVFHSVIIGVGLGVTTSSLHSVWSLMAALCFHQFFEGAGLSTAIIYAQLPTFKKLSMYFLFSITTSLGIVIGR